MSNTVTGLTLLVVSNRVNTIQKTRHGNLKKVIAGISDRKHCIAITWNHEMAKKLKRLLLALTFLYDYNRLWWAEWVWPGYVRLKTGKPEEGTWNDRHGKN